MKFLLSTLMLMSTFFSSAQVASGFIFSGCSPTTIANIGVGTWRSFPLPTPGNPPPWQIGDYSGMPPNWFQSGFPDGSWTTTINVLNTGIMNRAWVVENDEVHGALFRHEFNLSNLDGSFWFVALPNNQCRVFINGTNVGGIIQYPGGAKKICIPKSLLQTGTNTVAILATEYSDNLTTLSFGIYNSMNLSANIGNACIGNNGWIDLTVANTCGAMTYSWAGTNFGVVPTTEDIANLSPGSYTVTVEDPEGCTSEATYVVSGQPDPISIPLGTVDCDVNAQIQLPGYNTPGFSFAPHNLLNPASVSPIGLFDPSLAGKGHWIIEQTVVSGNGCVVTNYIHVQVVGTPPISIPLGVVDCHMSPVLLPGSGNPNTSFAPGPGLNSNAINNNDEFVPGGAGVGSWIIYQIVGTGLCADTNYIHVTVPEYEALREIDLHYFCANVGVDYFTIPGGGTLEVIQDPSGSAPYPITSNIISHANGFGIGAWQVKQTTLTAGGCIVETIYVFEIVGNCTCFPEINLTYTEDPGDCKVYNFTGGINYNGTIPIHWRWSIFDQSLYQIISQGSNTSPALNSFHDLSQLPIQVSGPQTVCFELWAEMPGQPGVYSYCKVCFSIDLCPPPMQPDNTPINSQSDLRANISLESTFYLLPNPTNGTVQIEGVGDNNIVNVQIYNTIGEIIMDKQTYRGLIDIADQPPGLYIVEVFDDFESHLLKLIKQ